MKLTRRGFTRLCGGAVVANGLLHSWPMEADVAGGTSPLTSKTLTELSDMIHAKQVTSTQLVKAFLERMNAINPKVNAIVTVMGREALAQAEVLDAEQKAGKFRGPLHGIPLALKDNIDTAGTRTTAASPMFKDRIPTEDAAIVAKLKKSGAIIIAKANLHEFAIGCTGDISYFGPARNPWALDHITGGSSSGSAASLAAYLVPGALGTDTGGSIRCPSAWCGTVGLMPTIGLVSIRGIIPCRASADHCGPMARTVEDVALMLGQMAGYDPLDIYSVPSTPVDYVKEMHQPVKTLRIGTPQSYYDHVDPEIDAAVKAALEVLKGLTAGVTSEAPLWEGLIGDTTGEQEEYHHELIEKYGINYMGPDRTRFAAMENPAPGTRFATAMESVKAHEQLATTRRMIDSHFTNFDVVVVPTTPMQAGKINDSLAQQNRSGPPTGKVYNWFETGGGCTNTRAFDLFGVPAISLPCGFTKAGLPIGLMIAAPHFQEGRVLALAYAYQQATDWHKRVPTLTAETPVPPIIEGAPAPGAGGGRTPAAPAAAPAPGEEKPGATEKPS
ncbi:aspartyl-tRNA(Asn)/glutamyl-tRNA(Gln) amidotransferase subunit A [Bryocella elongata]|uniref:Aspartyl-tRNA(Asn)/glutamyl-tRNA(Gln) amidotransferase subunit A n=1 Tax=Bryocella elongata TaxID=863522 RepID=A0A1H6C0A2_9BACT|nr:amidase [Bryocella elongata]SEG65826.1 aspartyl-tRNA(Asn)/glutamyl-tRNA(Gln) amidotransferase subunit A [Bryocella elongata]